MTNKKIIDFHVTNLLLKLRCYGIDIYYDTILRLKYQIQFSERGFDGWAVLHGSSSPAKV